MKKYIYSLLVLATSLVACTEDYTDWAQPQHNDQPETVTFGDGSVSAVGLIDFANIAEGQDMVKVCNVTAPTATSEAYDKASYILNIENAKYNLNENGEILTAELKSYVEDNFGKAPVERDIKATVEQWISNGQTAIKTATSAAFTIKAKLVAPYISEHYYVIGAPSEWNPGCTILPFSHSSQNVYDDPIFTVTFPVAAGETWFAITDDITLEHAPEGDAAWKYVLGCAEGNGNNGMEGGIKRRSELPDDGSWKIVADKDCSVKMTINMMDYTYKFEFINYKPFIYFIGATDGWSNAEQKLALTDPENGVYTGFIYCADPNGWGNQFKFQQVAGDWGTELNNGHFTTYSGAATDCGGNLGVSGGENVYYFSVNLGAGEIYAEEVTKMGIIGEFNGWGGDLDMTWNAAEYCYEADITTVTANGWKFRINADWAVNLGGDSLTDLVANGANLSATGSKCKLYPTRRDNDNIYCTIE